MFIRNHFRGLLAFAIVCISAGAASAQYVAQCDNSFANFSACASAVRSPSFGSASPYIVNYYQAVKAGGGLNPTYAPTSRAYTYGYYPEQGGYDGGAWSTLSQATVLKEDNRESMWPFGDPSDFYQVQSYRTVALGSYLSDGKTPRPAVTIPASSIHLTSSTGFTVLVRYWNNPASTIAPGTVQVFASLLQRGTSRELLTLGKKGSGYVLGREIENSWINSNNGGTGYFEQAWEPRDTVNGAWIFAYFTFLPDGKVRIDRFRLEDGASGSSYAYDWEQGLSDDGIPFTGYPVNGTGISASELSPIGDLVLGPVATGSIYTHDAQVPADGLVGVTTFAAPLNVNQIIAYQNDEFYNSNANLTFNSLPCNTGFYLGISSETHAPPSFPIHTPCGDIAGSGPAANSPPAGIDALVPDGMGSLVATEPPVPRRGLLDSSGLGPDAIDPRYLHVANGQMANRANTVVQLRGVNLGGWLERESWMNGELTPNLSSSANASNSISCSNSPNGFCLNDQYSLERLEARFGAAQAQNLILAWQNNFITDADFAQVAASGFNSIRLPFSWRNLQNADGTWIRDSNGQIDFSTLDHAMELAAKYNLYVVLDLHIWQGRQANYGNVVSGTSSPDLLSAATLWGVVADHYRGNGLIAGFDLLNEVPNTSPAVWETLYAAVRNADPERILIVERGEYDWMETNWTNLVYEPHMYNFDSTDLTTAQKEFNSGLSSWHLTLPSDNRWPVFVGEFKQEPNTASWLLSQYDHAGWSWTPWTWKGINNGGWAMVNYNLTPNAASATKFSPTVDLANDSYATILAAWSTGLAATQQSTNQQLLTPYANAATQPVYGGAGVGPAGFTFCATDPSTCSFTGTATVAYGANGSFNYLTETNGVACSSTIFGDPNYGTVKSCYYLISSSGTGQPTGPANFSYCAAQNGYCNFGGTQIVAFGSNGLYNYHVLSDGVSCDTTVLGDPNNGGAKACYIAATTTVPAGPAQSTYCASEGGQCVVSGTQVVAYGAGTFFTYITASAPVTCTSHSGIFGDPGSGGANSCFVVSPVPAGLADYTYCGPHDSECAWIGIASVAYGQTSTGFSVISAGNGTACVAGVFRSNQYGQAGDACFYKLDNTLTPPSPPFASGRYAIRNSQGTYLAAQSAATTTGQPTTQSTAPGVSLGIWQLIPISDDHYAIYNLANGLYLESTSGSSGNGATIDLASKTLKPNQIWQIVNSGGQAVFLNQVTGLSVDSGGGVAGQAAHQWNWFKGANQSWTLEVQAQGPAGYTFCGDHDTACNFHGVASVAYVAVSGTTVYSVQQNGMVCTPTAFGLNAFAQTGDACFFKTQTDTSGVPSPPLANGVYHLTAPQGYAIEVPGGNQAAGTTVDQQSLSASANFNWNFASLGDNHYRITNVATGLILGVQGASVNFGAPLDEETPNGALSQIWQIFPQGDGTFFIVNQNSGLAMDSAGGALGSQVHQWNWFTGVKNQQWKL